MNKRLIIEITSFLFICLMVGMTACVKDSCQSKHTYTYFTPVYKSRAEVLGSIKSDIARDIENPGKIYIHGRFIFLNEIDKGVHIIDNSNPSSPRNISFIPIPGNMDIAVKDNILYADMYNDLLALDISDARNVKEKKIIEGIFPERFLGNGFVSSGQGIVVDWIRKDTVVTENCEQEENIFDGMADVFMASSVKSNGAAATPAGTGGSMARFTIVNDYLYTVDRHTLKSVLVSNAADPVLKNNLHAGWDIETIYPFRDKLFLGSMGGMFIFNISNPAIPVAEGSFIHARACDPVIAEDDYAYVTLRAGSNCGPAVNELQVIDIKNLASPRLFKAYAMTGPAGLAKDGDLLFVCDGKEGLKVFDAKQAGSLQQVARIGDMETYDVIAMNKIALVVAKEGMFQYSYAQPNNIRLLSKIGIKK